MSGAELLWKRWERGEQRAQPQETRFAVTPLRLGFVLYRHDVTDG